MGVAASSCSSSSKKYEVFLSFRGEDTRRSFTSHLYAALRRSGIETYIDDEILKGDDISQSLIQAIENSSISVVIFSENNASSKWCLNELTEILRCKQHQKQHVVPIFYQVDPAHVRKQMGAYEEAFAQHLKNNPEKVNQWRQALFEIASSSGWDSRNFRSEAELIQNIVNDIMQKLNRGSSYAVPNIVGIDENSNHIESLLKKFSIIGIWGMGGIGKTTMAKVLYAKFLSQFDSCCFIENIGEESKKYGLKSIRGKLLSELSKDTTLGRFYHKKVFIVLDDVSNTNQLDELQRVAPSLGPGSKVIIISRDRHVLNGRVDIIHEAIALGDYSSHQLFNLKAFHKHDCESEYKELVDKAIAYAKGNPLALTTLGSFLYSKTVKEWESALRKLEMTANQDIQDVLRLSYDGLDHEEKEIFLDIAFFLKGESTRFILATLESCGFHSSICLRNLVDKALISIDYVVHMHDLIQSMAFEIVRQECEKNPEGRNRLQKPNEIDYVLQNNKGSDAIQGMSLDLSQIRYLQLSADALKKMTNLRFLKFYTPVHKMSCIVHLPSGLVSFSNPLRHLQLDKFSTKSQPLSFCAEKLVTLRMRGMHLKKLWDGVQNLVNLLFIDLSESKQLIELPDLSMAQNLESLDISQCQNLCHLHPSILSLPRLYYVNLDYCKNLKSLKFTSQSKSLSFICPWGCYSLKEVSVSSHRLFDLCLHETSVETLDISSGCMKNLLMLSLNGLILNNLPINKICFMRNLQELHLYDCGGVIDKSKLHTLFDALLSLRSICLKGTSKLTELPNNIKHICKLQSLDVSHCKDLQSLPELPPSIETVKANNCISLETIPISITSAPQLRFLSLQNCLKLEKHSSSWVMEWAYFSLKQSAHEKEKRYVCYPGSKAPGWFTFSQETKASNYVTIELPPSTNDLVGFIFFSVLSHDSDGYYLQCQLYYDGKQCKCFEFDMNVTNLDSHHVVLWCDTYPITNSIETMDDKNTNYMPSVSFEFSIVSWRVGVNAVIEGCGVCPIYSSEYREFLKEKESKLESITGKKKASEY